MVDEIKASPTPVSAPSGPSPSSDAAKPESAPESQPPQPESPPPSKPDEADISTDAKLGLNSSSQASDTTSEAGAENTDATSDASQTDSSVATDPAATPDGSTTNPPASTEQPLIATTPEAVKAQFSANGMEISDTDAQFFAERGGYEAWKLDPRGFVSVSNEAELLIAKTNKSLTDGVKDEFAKNGLNITDDEAKFWQERGGYQAWKQDPTGAVTVSPVVRDAAEVKEEFAKNGMEVSDADAQFFAERGGYAAWVTDPQGFKHVDGKAVNAVQEEFAQQGLNITVEEAMFWNDRGGYQAWQADPTGATSILNNTLARNIKVNGGDLSRVAGSDNIVGALNADGSIKDIYQVATKDASAAQSIPPELLNKQAVTMVDGFGKTDPKIIADNFIANSTHANELRGLGGDFKRVEGSDNVIAALDANGGILSLHQVTGEGIQASNIPPELLDKNKVMVVGGFGKSDATQLANNFIASSAEAQQLRAAGGDFRPVEGSNNVVAALDANGAIMGLYQIRGDASASIAIPPEALDKNKVSVVNGFGRSDKSQLADNFIANSAEAQQLAAAGGGFRKVAGSTNIVAALNSNGEIMGFHQIAGDGSAAQALDPGILDPSKVMVDGGWGATAPKIIEREVVETRSYSVPDPAAQAAAAAENERRRQAANEATWAFADGAGLGVDVAAALGTTDLVTAGEKLITERVAYKIQEQQTLTAEDQYYVQGAEQLLAQRQQAALAEAANLGAWALADAGSLNITLPPLPSLAPLDVGAQLKTESVANKLRTDQALSETDQVFKENAQKIVDYENKLAANAMTALGDAGSLGIEVDLNNIPDYGFNSTLANFGAQLQIDSAALQVKDAANLGVTASADAASLGVTPAQSNNGMNLSQTELGIQLMKEQGLLSEDNLKFLKQGEAVAEQEALQIQAQRFAEAAMEDAASIQERNGQAAANELGLSEQEQALKELSDKYGDGYLRDANGNIVGTSSDFNATRLGRFNQLMNDIKGNPSADQIDKTVKELDEFIASNTTSNGRNSSSFYNDDVVAQAIAMRDGLKGASSRAVATRNAALGDSRFTLADGNSSVLQSRYKDAFGDTGFLGRIGNDMVDNQTGQTETERFIRNYQGATNTLAYLAAKDNRTAAEEIDYQRLSAALTGISTTGTQANLSLFNQGVNTIGTFQEKSNSNAKGGAIILGVGAAAIASTVAVTATGGTGLAGLGLAAGVGAAVGAGTGATVSAAALGADKLDGGQHNFNDFKDVALTGGVLGGSIGLTAGVGTFAGGAVKAATQGNKVLSNISTGATQAGVELVGDRVAGVGVTLANGGSLDDAVRGATTLSQVDGVFAAVDLLPGVGGFGKIDDAVTSGTSPFRVIDGEGASSLSGVQRIGNIETPNGIVPVIGGTNSTIVSGNVNDVVIGSNGQPVRVMEVNGQRVEIPSRVIQPDQVPIIRDGQIAAHVNPTSTVDVTINGARFQLNEGATVTVRDQTLTARGGQLLDSSGNDVLSQFQGGQSLGNSSSIFDEFDEFNEPAISFGTEKATPTFLDEFDEFNEPPIEFGTITPTGNIATASGTPNLIQEAEIDPADPLQMLFQQINGRPAQPGDVLSTPSTRVFTHDGTRFVEGVPAELLQRSGNLDAPPVNIAIIDSAVPDTFLGKEQLLLPDGTTMGLTHDEFIMAVINSENPNARFIIANADNLGVEGVSNTQDAGAIFERSQQSLVSQIEKIRAQIEGKGDIHGVNISLGADTSISDVNSLVQGFQARNGTANPVVITRENFLENKQLILDAMRTSGNPVFKTVPDIINSLERLAKVDPNVPIFMSAGNLQGITAASGSDAVNLFLLADGVTGVSAIDPITGQLTEFSHFIGSSRADVGVFTPNVVFDPNSGEVLGFSLRGDDVMDIPLVSQIVQEVPPSFGQFAKPTIEGTSFASPLALIREVNIRQRQQQNPFNVFFKRD